MVSNSLQRGGAHLHHDEKHFIEPLGRLYTNASLQNSNAAISMSSTPAEEARRVCDAGRIESTVMCDVDVRGVVCERSLVTAWLLLMGQGPF